MQVMSGYVDKAHQVRCVADLMYLTRSRAQEKPPSTTVKVSWPFGGSPLSARMFWMP